MNYQSQYTIGCRNAAVGTWTYQGYLLPHPLAFMYNSVTDSIGSVGTNFLNTQITGATVFDKKQEFHSIANRWRVAYMSVTVYQDGPDLANQGMVSVCQFPSNPAIWNFSNPIPGGMAAFPHVAQYDLSTYPDFTGCAAYPNAYLNKGREGAYVPLKLTRTHQQWHSLVDEEMYTSGSTNFDTDLLTFLQLPVTTGITVFPIGGQTRAWSAGVGANCGGMSLPPMGNDTFASINFVNLAVTTSLKFYVRLGLEIQCLPGSVMSPHLKLSPEHDMMAESCYFAIARQLKDAYPADYNDLGEIWDRISEAAGAVLPGISTMGVPGMVVGGIGSAIKTIGDVIRASTKSKAADAATSGTANATASAADVARVAQAVSQPPQLAYGPAPDWNSIMASRIAGSQNDRANAMLRGAIQRFRNKKSRKNPAQGGSDVKKLLKILRPGK